MFGMNGVVNDYYLLVMWLYIGVGECYRLWYRFRGWEIDKRGFYFGRFVGGDIMVSFMGLWLVIGILIMEKEIIRWNMLRVKDRNSMLRWVKKVIVIRNW